MKTVLAVFGVFFLLVGSVWAVDVAMVAKAMNSEWWQSVRAGAEEFAAGREDMRLGVYYPDREVDIDRQMEIIRERIAAKADALVMALCGIQEMMPVLEEVEEAGVPYVIFDGDVDTDSSWKRAYVGSENYDGGALAGRFALGKLARGGDVAIITGVMGHGSHIGRVAGFVDGIRANPAIRIVSQQAADSERGLSRRVTQGILEYYPRLSLIFATNDEMALGAAEAAGAMGRKVHIIGFDGIGEARDAVRAGVLLGSVDSNPFRLGYEAARAGYLAAKGEEVPERITIEYGMITRDGEE